MTPDRCPQAECRGAEDAPSNDRRGLFKIALGWLVALGWPASGTAATGLPVAPPAQPASQPADPRRARPQTGDVFVHAFGDREGRVVTVDDLEVGQPQVTAWAKDPESGVVRDGSRLNQVLLVRLEPDEIGETTRALSADGVVAYSGICPHTGCDVSRWRSETGNLLCSCHDSEFDPRDLAEVRSGPAPRRLPALPLASDGGVLVAAGGFTAKIRFQQGL